MMPKILLVIIYLFIITFLFLYLGRRIQRRLGNEIKLGGEL